MGKFILFIFIPCILLGKDFGVHGATFPIAEENLLKVIQQKLLKMESNGTFKAMQQKIVKKTLQSLENPKPTNLPIATSYERRLFDPTYIVPHDIKNHHGKKIILKGTKINPLDYFNWGEPLLLIDSTNADQLKWVKSQKGIITLLKGNPFKISKQLKRTVYFDQESRIVSHFHLTHTPCRVSQFDKHLLIEEFPL